MKWYLILWCIVLYKKNMRSYMDLWHVCDLKKNKDYFLYQHIANRK